MSELSFEIFDSPESDAGLLLLSGWKTPKEASFERAQQWRDRGLTVMTFDWNGETGQDYVNDARTAYKTLAATENVADDQIHVVAASLGCPVVCAGLLESEDTPVASVVLRAPGDFPNDIMERSVDEYIETGEASLWMKDEHDSHDSPALAGIERFSRQRRVLLVSGEEDQTIPKATIENYGGAIHTQNGAIIEIPGADHSLTPVQEVFYQRTVGDWLTKKN